MGRASRKLVALRSSLAHPSRKLQRAKSLVVAALLIGATLVLFSPVAVFAVTPTQCVVNAAASAQTGTYSPNTGATTFTQTISRIGCTTAGQTLVLYIYAYGTSLIKIADNQGNNYTQQAGANYFRCAGVVTFGVCPSVSSYGAFMEYWVANMTTTASSIVLTLTGTPAIAGTGGVISWEFWNSINPVKTASCVQGVAYDQTGTPANGGGGFSCTTKLPASGLLLEAGLYTQSGSGATSYQQTGTFTPPVNNAFGLQINNNVCSTGTYDNNVCNSFIQYRVNPGGQAYYSAGLGPVTAGSANSQSFFTLNISFASFASPAQAFSVVITNMDLGNYLLPNGKAYDFLATVSSFYVTGLLNSSPVFQTTVSWNDSNTVVTATYDNTTRQFNLNSGSSIVALTGGAVSTTINKGYLTLNVNFLFTLTGSVLDATNRGIYLSATSGPTQLGPIQVQSNYFNILNRGGGLSVLKAGSCSIPAGSDTFETACQYGSNAHNWIAENATYYQLQAYQGQFAMQMNNVSNGVQIPYFWQNYANSGPGTNPSTNKGDWQIRMGLYQWDNQSSVWVKGVNVVMEMDQGRVGSTNLWTQFYAFWYDGNTLISNQTYIAFVPTDTNNGLVNIWVNLWYSQNNASTVEGGQVSAYYTGMHNTNYLVWSTWSPFLGNQTASQVFVPLLNKAGLLSSAANSLYTKVYFNMTRPGAPLVNAKQYNFQIKTVGSTIKEFQQASSGDMGGITTPTFAPAIVPILQGSSIFSPIINALKTLASWIATALSAVGAVIWAGLGAKFPWFTSTMAWFASLIYNGGLFVAKVIGYAINVISFMYASTKYLSYPVNVITSAWATVGKVFSVFSGVNLTQITIIMILVLFSGYIIEANNSRNPAKAYIELARTAWHVMDAVAMWVWYIAKFLIDAVEGLIP